MADELDCRGMQCPEPVARCRKLISEMKTDEMRVLVDNAAALENVGRFLERRGFMVNTNQLGANEWRIDASKQGQMTQVEEKAAPEPDAGRMKTLVLLTTDTMGRGDDELGAKLLNTFLANLNELGPSLWRIILLNGAVRLSAREGEALKHLQALQAAGVDVLVCGTCLMHYGLLEKKQVGETTNMMDVISSLALAQKVIRP